MSVQGYQGPRDNDYAPLKPKLHPYCLGHTKCTSHIAPRARDVVAAMHSENAEKTHNHTINTLQYRMQLYRSAPQRPRGPNIHLSGINKAAKVRNYIEQHGLTEYFAVQKTWITHLSNEDFDLLHPQNYQLSHPHLPETTDRFVAITEPLELNPEAKFTPTTIQAKALAELLFLGLIAPTCSWSITKNRKIALTRFICHEKAEHKEWKQSLLGRLFWNNSMRYRQGFSGTSLLKAVCKGDNAAELHKAIVKVELKHFLFGFAQAVGRIALCCLCLYTLPKVLVCSGLLQLVVVPIKMGCMTATGLSLTAYAVQAFYLARTCLKSLRRQPIYSYYFESLM